MEYHDSELGINWPLLYSSSQQNLLPEAGQEYEGKWRETIEIFNCTWSDEKDFSRAPAIREAKWEMGKLNEFQSLVITDNNEAVCRRRKKIRNQKSPTQWHCWFHKLN
jgi:hypothetical protein